jgi:protein phosphatase
MDRGGRIAGQLKQSVFLASEAVESVLAGDGGSTVVIGIIFHERLFFACVGDSFLYLMRDGKLIRLNVEHNLCNQMYLENIRDGIFDPTECRADPEAAALSQFLGMPGLSEVDCSVRPMFLQRGDVLLACSDGIGGVLDEQEILDALSYQSEHEACRQLEQRLVEHCKPNQDNYTSLIVKCV